MLPGRGGDDDDHSPNTNILEACVAVDDRHARCSYYVHTALCCMATVAVAVRLSVRDALHNSGTGPGCWWHIAGVRGWIDAGSGLGDAGSVYVNQSRPRVWHSPEWPYLEWREDGQISRNTRMGVFSTKWEKGRWI